MIGRGVSNANDAWSITANQALADGSYAITAIAVDSSGHTISSTTTIVPALVIDTVGPKVTNVSFARLSGEILVTIQDYGGPGNRGVGLNPSSLDRCQQLFIDQVPPAWSGRFSGDVHQRDSRHSRGIQLVTLQFNGGKYLRGGHYFFTVRSVSPTDRRAFATSPAMPLMVSSMGISRRATTIRGGDFIAELDAVHHIIFAPKTVIGTATPVSPPGTLPSNTTIPTHNPGDPTSKSHKQPTTAKAKKIEPVTVTKKAVAQTNRCSRPSSRSVKFAESACFPQAPWLLNRRM